jgi:hypothetical protein
MNVGSQSWKVVAIDSIAACTPVLQGAIAKSKKVVSANKEWN